MTTKTQTAAEHTPGPWRVGQRSTATIGTPLSEQIGALEDSAIIGGGGSIAFVFSPRGAREEREANARLIAAAPAMLDALREVAAFLAGEADTDYASPEMAALRARVESVITQATGAGPSVEVSA